MLTLTLIPVRVPPLPFQLLLWICSLISIPDLSSRHLQPVCSAEQRRYIMHAVSLYLSLSSPSQCSCVSLCPPCFLVKGNRYFGSVICFIFGLSAALFSHCNLSSGFVFKLLIFPIKLQECSKMLLRKLFLWVVSFLTVWECDTISSHSICSAFKLSQVRSSLFFFKLHISNLHQRASQICSYNIQHFHCFDPWMKYSNSMKWKYVENIDV